MQTEASRERSRYTLPMSRPVPAKRRATYADLERVSDHMVAEIVDGDLYATPRPSVAHTIATSGLASDLGGPFDRGRGGPGGWWILAEPELHLGDDIVVPDLAGWRRTRLPELPGGAFLAVAPNWVCETVSPSTERLDRGKKLPIYARESVEHVWLVNPLAETLEAYRLEQGRWLLLNTHAGDVSARIEPFDAIELELWRLWGRSEPR
jgi:Uma2 family endonuclease